MMRECLNVDRLFSHLVAKRPILDVRAPIEFAHSHLPGATNFPLLNDEERAAVGKEYKAHGQPSAIALGEKLVSGPVREQRIEAWRRWLAQNPDALITCFRGGLRSQITQSWLSEAGFDFPRLAGGFKAARTFLDEKWKERLDPLNIVLLSGQTGSGKTRLLRECRSAEILDLEFLAHHRGSAFGALPGGQPTQAQFELELAVAGLRVANSPRVLIEDESRMIGSSSVPETLFSKMREAPVIWLQVSVEDRAEEIFSEYVRRGLQESSTSIFDHFLVAVQNISRKLGGLRAQELIKEINDCKNRYQSDPSDLDANRGWITKLLEWYYDPLYLKSLEKRKPGILFSGNRKEVREYLSLS